MEFIITRTSRTDNHMQPCAEAKEAKAAYTDWRRVESLNAVRAQPWGSEWLQKGTNHREEGGMIARELDTHIVWVIDFKNLKGLLEFYKRYGELIITKSPYRGYPFEIEIYDDYRE